MIPFELALPNLGRTGRVDRILTDWELEDYERRALNVMLTVLFRADHRLAVGSIIFKEKEAGIYYAKATGKIQLRPRLCRGPERPNEEVTFLVRAIEKDRKTIPPDASRRAVVMQDRVTKDPTLRKRYKAVPYSKSGS